MLRFSVVLHCSNFRALGLDPARTYSEQEVKAAYRAKAKTVHPDVKGGSDAGFRAVHAAYQAVAQSGCAAAAGNPSGSSTSHAVGDEQVFSARRPYADMYAQWHPEQSAAETSRGTSSSTQDDVKWYTYATHGSASSDDGSVHKAESRNARRDFYNPYGGKPTGPLGHERDSANDSTKDFYRAYSSGSYKATDGGYTDAEIRNHHARNRNIIWFMIFKRVSMSMVLGYIVFLLTFAPSNKVRILEAEKAKGMYSAEYLSTLPNTGDATSHSPFVNGAVFSSSPTYKRTASVHRAPADEPMEGGDLVDNRTVRRAASAFNKADWEYINSSIMERNKSKSTAGASSDEGQKTMIVDQGRPYASSFRGQPFTAEGLQKLQAERKLKKQQAGSGAIKGSAPSPAEIIAQSVPIASAQLPPALRAQVQVPRSEAYPDDMSYDADD